MRFLPEGSELPHWAAGLVGDHALDGTAEQDSNLEPPRRSGPGSSAAAWRAYADQQDVDVAEDADQDDVIAAQEAADVPVD